jgi:hypothetical protein
MVLEEQKNRNWAMGCHLAALALYIGIPFGNIFGPLIIWLIKKDEIPLVDEQGKESLNFQISLILYGVAIGDSEEMLRAKALLDEVKESIINAYELKSGLSRAKISHLMDAETWMNANKAIELGFADKILFMESDERIPLDTGQGLIFSRAAVYNSLLGKIPKKTKPKTGTPIEQLEKRLFLISH